MAENVELRRTSGNSYDEKLNVKTSWDIIENKPTNFTPDVHSHNIEEVNTLEDELDNRYTKTETDTKISEEIGKIDIPTHLSELSQNASYRTVTDTEKATWNAKETTTGSQAKADNALASAKTYTDSEVSTVITELDSFKTLKGVPNGLAELNENGHVPATQLPSYVDDLEEYADRASFPTTGESDKIYVDKNTNKIYRWSRTDYVEISKSLALGETTSTAYAGSKGKANRDDINTILSTYATQGWVENKNYVNTAIVNSMLLNYAKIDDIPSLAGYATQSWVEGKNYAKVTDIPTVPTDLSAFNNDMQFLTFQDVQGNYVPISRTINSKPLSSNINLTAADVGAMPAGTVRNTYVTSGNYSEVPPGKRWVSTSVVSNPDYSVGTTADELSSSVLPSANNLSAGTTGHVYTQSLPMEEAYYIVQEVGESEGLITLRRNDNRQVSFTIPKPGEGGATENNYVTRITGSGNSTIRLERAGLSDLTLSLTHSHGSLIQSNDIPNNQVLDKISVSSGIVQSFSFRTMTPAHIGAAPASHTHNYVPTSRTVNGKALSSNISLSASDVSAVPTTRTIAGRALSSNITASQLKSDLSVPTTLDDLIVAGEGQIAVRGGVDWIATDTAPNTTRWGGYRIRVGSYSSGLSGYITFGI